ncbi:EamA family transporter [Francisella sp. SYW-9]|uniref:EamA family transporter n=1 Tax=Francisella sp. SYW-9 TaxID=2610888 RepID=UPI00123CCF05|nr:EamA family transporter [Francisella sp. SYW-9]
MKLKFDFFIGALVTIMWGFNFCIIELGLKDLDPFILILLRFFFCFFPIIFFIRKPEVSWFAIIIYGVLFGAGLWWMVSFAIYEGLSVGISSVFLQFAVFFTIILSFLILSEKISKSHIFGMIISLIGLLIIIFSSKEHSTIEGILLVLSAALSWALCNIIVKITKPSDMFAFIIWSSLFSTIAVLIITIIVKGYNVILLIPNEITLRSSFSVLFQSYITTILGYYIWNNLMKKHLASSIAPLSLLTPPASIICAYIFFGDTLSISQIVSVIIVIFGISIFFNLQQILLLRPKK